MTEAIHNMLSEKIDQVKEDLGEVKSDLSGRIDRMDTKLDGIHTWMVAHPQCPSPGRCVDLGVALQAQTARVERLELRILSIEKWQNKVIGIGSVLIVGVTLFGPSIRKLLNLP